MEWYYSVISRTQYYRRVVRICSKTVCQIIL